MAETADLSDKDIEKILSEIFHKHGGSFRCLHEKIKNQLIMGYRVELEHSKRVDPRLDVTDGDPMKTIRIALVHISEGPDYYDRLKKMESEMDDHWEDSKNSTEKKQLKQSIEEAVMLLSK